MRKNIGIFALGAILLGTMAVAETARADTIDIMADMELSTEGVGDFSGTIQYAFDGLVGNLVISLTNTTDPEIGGYITGFVFNIAGDAEPTLVEAPSGFREATDTKGMPFGAEYDIGAVLGGKFLGGGSPTGGIAIGDSGIFAFEVTGADAPSLTASSFIEGGQYEHNFVVRFKGGIDSDKVVPATMMVPLPAPVALGALGLLGAGWGSRRVRRRRSAS